MRHGNYSDRHFEDDLGIKRADASISDGVHTWEDQAHRWRREAFCLWPWSVFCPILQPQSADPLELRGVVADERQAARHGLTGDQDVIGADRRAAPRKLRPDLVLR